jgi:hypothetical protein
MIGWLATGCQPSAGPVTKITLDSAKVQAVKIYPDKKALVVVDRGLIDRCVAEINQLSWESHKPRITEKAADVFRFEGRAGAPLVEFRVYAPEYDAEHVPFVEVRIPGKKQFFIEYSRMRTVGKLFSYHWFDWRRTQLKRICTQAEWTDDTQWEAKKHLSFIDTYCAGLDLSKGDDIADIRKDVETLDRIGLEDIDRFADYFELPP